VQIHRELATRKENQRCIGIVRNEIGAVEPAAECRDCLEDLITDMSRDKCLPPEQKQDVESEPKPNDQPATQQPSESSPTVKKLAAMFSCGRLYERKQVHAWAESERVDQWDCCQETLDEIAKRFPMESELEHAEDLPQYTQAQLDKAVAEATKAERQRAQEYIRQAARGYIGQSRHTLDALARELGACAP
jgi:hypothetical protein